MKQASADGADKIYKAVSTLHPSGARPFVINGTEPADPNDWQATLLTSDGGINCTATIIGARVVLTAAHCLEKGPVIGFELKDVPYFADCTMSPRYIQDKSADYALCLTRVAISGIPFERLSFDRAELARATTLTLAGYGCTRVIAPIFKGFQIGRARLLKRPGEIPNQPNLLQVGGGAALCLGDSGGGAYVVRRPSSTRRLVAINAVLDGENPDDLTVTSSLASVSTTDFLCFGTEWLRNNAGKAAIAGFPTPVRCQ